MTRLVAAGFAVAAALHRHHELGLTSSVTSAQSLAASFQDHHGKLAHEIVDATGDVEPLPSADFQDDLVEVEDLTAGAERNVTSLESPADFMAGQADSIRALPVATSRDTEVRLMDAFLNASAPSAMMVGLPMWMTHLKPVGSQSMADSIAMSGHADAPASHAVRSMADLVDGVRTHSDERGSGSLADSIALSTEPDDDNNARPTAGSMADFMGRHKNSTHAVPVTTAHDTEGFSLLAAFSNASFPSALLADSTMKSSAMHIPSRLEPAPSQSMADIIAMHGHADASAVHAFRFMAGLVAGASPQHKPVAGSLAEAIAASAEPDDVHHARHFSGSIADFMARHEEGSANALSVPENHTGEIRLLSAFRNSVSARADAAVGLLADAVAVSSDSHASTALYTSMADRIRGAGSDAHDKATMADIMAANMDALEARSRRPSSMADFIARGSASSMFKVVDKPAFDWDRTKPSANPLTLALAALKDHAAGSEGVIGSGQPNEPFFVMPNASEVGSELSIQLRFSCLALLALGVSCFCLFHDSSKSSGEEVRQKFKIQCPPCSKAWAEYESAPAHQFSEESSEAEAADPSNQLCGAVWSSHRTGAGHSADTQGDDAGDRATADDS